MEQFKKILIKGGRVTEIKQTNYEKYPAFQAIRWGYAEIIKTADGDIIIPKKKWTGEKLH